MPGTTADRLRDSNPSVAVEIGRGAFVVMIAMIMTVPGIMLRLRACMPMTNNAVKAITAKRNAAE